MSLPKMIPVDSSAIQAIGYDTSARELLVHFRNTRIKNHYRFREL